MVNAFPAQPEDDLRVDTAWRERYSSASMNQKIHGVLPKGIYSGFKVSVQSGLQVKIHGDGQESIALVEVGSYSLTARMPHNKSKVLTIVPGKVQYVTLEVTYGKNIASRVGCYVRDKVPENAIVLAVIETQSGASSLSQSNISLSTSSKPVREADFASLLTLTFRLADQVFTLSETVEQLSNMVGLDDGEPEVPSFKN